MMGTKKPILIGLSLTMTSETWSASRVPMWLKPCHLYLVRMSVSMQCYQSHEVNHLAQKKANQWFRAFLYTPSSSSKSEFDSRLLSIFSCRR